MIFAILLACSEIGVSDTLDPPTVTFISPVDLGTFDPLQPVDVCVRVAWDGDLSNLDAVLVSDIDGTLADSFDDCPEGDLGLSLSLSDATHVLAFTVSDANNRSDTAEITLSPASNSAPSCTVSSPLGSTFEVDQPVPIDVVPSDADGDSLTIEVESSLDGLVSSGSWTQGFASFTPTLTAGSHTLLVQVSDPRGAIGTCSTAIEVLACVDADQDGFETCDGDCDDADPHTYPGAPETPDGIDNDCDNVADEGTDLYDDDGDGSSEFEGDCDDADPHIHTGANEIPDDGIDQDCSGSDGASCFIDADGDGFGFGSIVSDDGDCTDQGETDVGDDCDDIDPHAYPGAPEIPGDGIDQNCDGADPDGCFEDGDGDGFGSTVVIPDGDGDCDDPGESGTSDDCNDALHTVYPGAPELPDTLDNDCDGVHDEGTHNYDDDGDGVSEFDGDCDDDDAHILPGAIEIPDDGIDQDCSGSDSAACFADHDDDGHGDEDAPLISDDDDCTDAGESPLDDDCDDGDPHISPSAIEIPADHIDQNCDGIDPDGCFQDLDEDGFGSTVVIPAGDGDCEDLGESGTSDDCNDALHTVYPGAPELPDTLDNDCDHTVDEGTDLYDDDGDGFDELHGDCDDDNPHIYTGAPEIPDDHIDQDCDGSDAAGCYEDLDGDHFGSAVLLPAGDADCDDPGESAVNTDCNDANHTIYPGAIEILDDGTDQDCSDFDSVTCYVDGDGDHFGGPTVVPEEAVCTVGYAVSDDCDDHNAGVFPNATEFLDDGIDQDCSGFDSITCYLDTDGDHFGHGVLVSVDEDCLDGHEADQDGDCDDTMAGIYPGATEIPDDTIDQDCSDFDSVTCFEDHDGDHFGNPFETDFGEGVCNNGLTLDDQDCDDTDIDVNPDALDPFGGGDTNCDGVDGVDADGDGYAAIVGLDGEDCDDNNPHVNPDTVEAHDGVDNNCDGFCDEGLIGHGDLVISELMIDAVGDEAQQEYFELYNNTGVEIRFCDGWNFTELHGGGENIAVSDDDLVVAPGGYVVFGRSANLATNGGAPVDHVIPMVFGNSGDELEVYFQGVLIDAVAWTSGFDAEGVSQELSVLDADANDDTSGAGPWCDSVGGGLTEGLGTPGAANSCP